MGKKRLGDSLHERGKISKQALENAIQEQAGTAALLGELLLDRGLISRADLIASLEEVTRTPYVDASSVTVKDKILERVPGRIARRYCALPLAVEHNKLKVVMEKPQDLQALKELSFASGLNIVPSFGFRNEIMAAVRRHYQDWDVEVAEGEGEQAGVASIEFFTTTSTQRNLDAIREFQAELHKRPTPAVRLVSAIIAEAAAKRASDIHIDPQAQGLTVRIRVDGILRDLMEIPSRLQASLVSRIKILADMDIAERRAPQDGRLLVALNSEKCDLRVSTLPTHCGEKVVIRLLDSREALVRFQDLGLWEEHADLMGHLLKMPQGMILVTGPTGSGKTTTLYAALNFLRSRNLNIITVEDPVEYRLEGVNQVQVHEKAGRTFPASLRSILRQDPNVIMVGEIRDIETAEIALRAAQTGHLLLSTMHTRDSVSAIARLIDLGIPNFLIASTVTAIIAQRLVRRLCECRDEVSDSPECTALMEEAGLVDAHCRMLIPVGCPACDKTGYRGRVGVYEMLVFDEAISESIRSGASPLEIRRTAQTNGLRTLAEDALLKVKMGLTSLEEAMRVVLLKNADAGGTRRENREGHAKPGERLRSF